jgi:hypothetical protein
MAPSPKFPKVLIVILNWNGRNDSLECLESVFRTDYPDFVVVVVDNGSTDGSPEAIENVYPRSIVIRNAKNTGFTGGNNIAIRYGLQEGADLFWLLNNDTVVETDTLGKLVEAALSKEEIGLVSPVVYFYDERERIQYCGCFLDTEGYRFRHAPAARWGEGETIRENELNWGTALLITRKVVEEIGFLDEKYFAYYEDFEYSLRAKRSGFTSVIRSDARIFHKDSRATGSRTSPMQVFLRTRNLHFLWMDILKGWKKFDFVRTYLAEHVLGGYTFFKKKGYPESAEACLHGAWAAFRRRGGEWDRAIQFPRPLIKLLTWHPYLLRMVLRGDCSGIAGEINSRMHSRFSR